MAVDTQLLKGILEGCVLGIIVRGETYGYEILSELEKTGLAGIGEGTLYPVLTRLDKQGLIQCRKAKSPLGPIRKYYTITPEGCEKLQSFQADFQTIVVSVEQILEQK
ncbi:PadR family transcriptional regulator [Streptococcus ovis]|uniref:PadR family transcriptional regulator n=1 Tax=Streptococcus ovis TaxID=82806 RepID=UPI000375E64A|nr:PadR family transcriptional regulator [Streptococcus ovis]